MKEYRLPEFDLVLLREARRQIEKVHSYHYGAPRSGRVVGRLGTILDKLDYLLGAGEEKSAG